MPNININIGLSSSAPGQPQCWAEPIMLQNLLDNLAKSYVDAYVGTYYARGVDKLVRKIETKTIKVSGNEQALLPFYDKPITLQLGGTFLEVGNRDESVGGNNQNVG